MVKSRRVTRRNRRGGGLFDAFQTPTMRNMGLAAAAGVKSRGAYNLAHSKSRVANVLSQPGTVRYTNKERIQSEIDEKIDDIKEEYGLTDEDLVKVTDWAATIKPKEAVNSMKTLSNQIRDAVNSAAPTAAAVTITIPIALAQLAWKVLRIFIAIWLFLLAIPGSMLGMANVSGPVAAVLPNANFQTSKNSFNFLKDYFSR